MSPRIDGADKFGPTMGTINSASSIEISTASSRHVGTKSTSESIVARSSIDSSSVSLSTLDTTTPSTPSTSSGPSDSPPMATDSVVFPDDPDWTSTYTYFEMVKVPTVTLTEVEMPTPTVEPFCMLDQLVTPGATFNLLDLQSGFIVFRDGRPGTPAPSESEEEAKALLAKVEKWQPPLLKPSE